MDHHQRYAGGRGVTWLSMGLNVTIGVAKCLVGYFGHSRALVADGLHSLADLGSDVAVLVGMRYASAPPDDDHPYGHQKISSMVTVLIALSIMLFCLLLIFDSVRALGDHSVVVPHWPTLLVAIGSIGVKEFLFRRTMRIARAAHSRMLMANAWHHRTDALTSLIAAVGITAAIVLGPQWVFLDALVGVALGVYLLVESLKLFWSSVQDLLDAAPGREIIDDLREHILPVSGAVAYHDFRARRIGDVIEVDLHLLVDPQLTLGDAHDVASRVKAAIMEHHPEVIQVLIHIEPALPAHAKERGVFGGVESKE